MAEPDDIASDSLEYKDEPKSSARILAAITHAERSLRSYQDDCDRIDEVYGLHGTTQAETDWHDPEYDLFWASTEILKPAIYARAPQPVVSPQFKDRRPLPNLTAELLERAVTSAFIRGGLDEVMQCLRDDLIFYNRGQMWLTYETDQAGGGQRVCIEHLDRKDFLHEPARKWAEVGWVARRAWMTRREMRDRFRAKSGDAYQQVTLASPKGRGTNAYDVEAQAEKAPVWEVWHRSDRKVYWVAEGSPVVLDQGEPHLKLAGFYPCPRPAYGTIRARSRVPVPDYRRYQAHLRKISDLTARIYLLLDKVKLKGLIPAGGDIGDAVEQLFASDDDQLLIPVPSAALIQGASGFVTWIPLAEIATAIKGLIEARQQLFNDFYQLSGISDIMRGATDADETLGAQQLKSQYGSVRVREKIDELQRIARDATQIAAEIMAENFSKETLLEMSQMEVSTGADIKKRISALEDAAEKEMAGITKEAEKAAGQAQQPGQQIDPKQAEAALQAKQQQVFAKYAPQIKAASEQVPIEDVMKLLRDQKARGFAFEIATDSTILVDEMAEKASRNEFMGIFINTSKALVELAALGEPGAKLAGELLRFNLAPYRAGREVDSAVDAFIDAAPEMAAKMAQQQSQGGDKDAQAALAQANLKIAEAEAKKAEAAVAKVQADAAKSQQEIQVRAAEAAKKAEADQQRVHLEMQDTQGKIAETSARIEKIYAEIQKMGADTDNQARQQDREDFKAATDAEAKQFDQSMAVGDRQRQAIESDRDAAMGERQQGFAEDQSRRGEDRADRQQDFAEHQARQSPQ